MKFSLIGTGFIFPTHVQAIREVGGEVVDVVNDARGTEVWREMVHDTKADCIVVLTPNDLHCEMALTSADKGKVVLCEKPLCITSKDAQQLAQKQNVFTVLQLRHHPLVRQLRENIDPTKQHQIEIDISVYRDPEYYTGWKGMRERSGGVLFNLGIHYFDLLVHLFGEPRQVTTSYLDDKTGAGSLQGDTYTCTWRISTGATKEDQRRVFKVNGVSYNFSSRDNLAFENLHGYVYKDLLEGKGVSPQDEVHSIALVEKLYSAYGK